MNDYEVGMVAGLYILRANLRGKRVETRNEKPATGVHFSA